MSVTFGSYGSTVAAAGATVSPDIDTGCSEGDLLLLVIEGEGEDANADAQGDFGGTLMATVASSEDGSNPNTRCTVYAKRADSSDAGGRTVTGVGDTGNHTVAIIMRWRSTASLDLAAKFVTSNSNASATTTHSIAGGTTTEDDAMVVFAITHGDNVGTSGGTGTNLSNLANRRNGGTNDGSDGSFRVFEGELATAGSVGTLSTGTSQSEHHAAVVVEVYEGDFPSAAEEYDETGLSVTVASTTSGTDTVTLAEAGPAVTVASAVTGTDLADRVESLATTIVAALTGSDLAAQAESLTVTVAAIATSSNTATRAESLSATLAASVDGTDTYVAVYGETGLGVVVVTNVAGTDLASAVESLAVTAIAAVTAVDAGTFGDPVAFTITATLAGTDVPSTAYDETGLGVVAVVAMTVNAVKFYDHTGLSQTAVAVISRTDSIHTPGLTDETGLSFLIVAVPTITGVALKRIWLGLQNPDAPPPGGGSNLGTSDSTWYSDANSGGAEAHNITGQGDFIRDGNPNGLAVQLVNDDVDGNQSVGARLNMQGFDDPYAENPDPHGGSRIMPVEGWYAVDMLYPTFIDAQDLVFQFKQGNGSTRQHIWNVGWRTISGQTRFIIRTRLTAGTSLWQQQPYEVAALSTPVPINQKFRLLVFRRMSTGPDGRYEVYLNGTLIYEFDGPTIASNLTPRSSGNHEWVVAHYLGAHQGAKPDSYNIVGNATVELGDELTEPDPSETGLGVTAVATVTGIVWEPDIRGYVHIPDGASVTTPDHASLDVGGDIDLRADVALENWDSDADDRVGLVSRVDDERVLALSWDRLDGRIELQWTESDTTLRTETSLVLDKPAPGSSRQLRATLDLDDGGVYEVRFYYRDDQSDLSSDTGWTLINVIQGADTTDIIASTAPVHLGADPGLALAADVDMIGKFYGARLYAGLSSAGTVVADPDFTDDTQTSDAGLTFVDSTSKTWTLNGSADWVTPAEAAAVNERGRKVVGSVSLTGFDTSSAGDIFEEGVKDVVAVAVLSGSSTFQSETSFDDHVALGGGSTDNVTTPDHADFDADFGVIADAAGESVDTPHHSSFNVPTDGVLELRADFALNSWDVGDNIEVIGKWAGATSGRSFGMWVARTADLLQLRITDDAEVEHTINVDVAGMFTAGLRYQFRWELDTVDGAWILQWRDDGDIDAVTGWTTLDSGTDGAYTIQDTTSDLSLGTGYTSSFNFDGSVFAARLIIDGTTVANPDFRDDTQTSDSGLTFVDDHGRTWTLDGGASWSDEAAPSTDDLDIRIDIALDDWTIEAGLVDRWGTAAANRQFALIWDSSERLKFLRVSEGVTAEAFSASQTFTALERHQLRVTHDVSDGDVAFYVRSGAALADLSSDTGWTAIGTASIADGGLDSADQPVTLGGNADGGIDRAIGKLYGARITLDALAGDPDFSTSAQTSDGGLTFVDSTSKTWTLNGAASWVEGNIDYSEPRLMTVSAGIVSTDTADRVNIEAVTITATLAGSDVLTLADGTADETGLTVTIAAALTVTDVHNVEGEVNETGLSFAITAAAEGTAVASLDENVTVTFVAVVSAPFDTYEIPDSRAVTVDRGRFGVTTTI